MQEFQAKDKFSIKNKEAIHRLKKEETVWPKRHKFGKIEQLLEQFEDTKTRMEKEKGGWSLQEFWKFYKYAYFIFCVDKEEDILKNYELFPSWLKEANEKYKTNAI